MANSLFLPNHSFIAPPRLSASLSSKSSKPLPLPRLGFSLNNSSSIISQSSSSSSRSGSISRSRRASSFKSHLAPRDSVPPVSTLFFILSSFLFSIFVYIICLIHLLIRGNFPNCYVLHKINGDGLMGPMGLQDLKS